jgi:hypothetical protein
MRPRIRLIDADTGDEVQTFDPYALALANGDPLIARVLMEQCRLILNGFRPAREFWPTPAVPTYKKLLGFLKRHKEIRWRSCPRLQIYAPDWLRYGPEAFAIDWDNLPAPILDNLVERCRERKQRAETIQQSKRHH